MVQENKISLRQLRRILFIEMFGTGALSIPALACYKGQSGFLATLFYGIFLIITTFLFFILSEKIQNAIPENTERNNYADSLPPIIQIVYIVRFFLNAVALFYFFGKTIQTVYMPRSGFLFILFPAAVLLWYSLHTNLQKRARFLELIFPWIAIMYLIAVILSFLGIENVTQAGTGVGIWPGALSDTIFQNMKNAYFLLLCSSPIEFLLFLKPTLELPNFRNKEAKIKESENQETESKKIKESENQKAGSKKTKINGAGNQKIKRLENQEKGNNETISIFITVFGVFLCNIILIFLAVRTLGQTLTGQSEWPVIKMMQLIHLPGGFLERFDILPIVFWILCMTAVLSGYLYYGRNIFESVPCFQKTKNCPMDSYSTENDNTDTTPENLRNTDTASQYLSGMNRTTENLSKYRIPLYTGISILCLLFFSWLVEKQPVLWTFYLKYKMFVDFPLSLLLPVIVYTLYRKKEKNIEKSEEDLRGEKVKKIWNEKEKTLQNTNEINREKKKLSNSQKTNQKNITNKSKKVIGKEKFSVLFLIILASTFILSGCQRLTDVEEKSYILSLYVDYSSKKDNVYEFWVARADLNKMEERDEEIPCEVTKIKAKNLQELEEKYVEAVPGETEWNHIYTIFLGSGIAAEKNACTRLLKEWDNAWQKSPNVLLVLCPESPEKLYKIKNIPEGAAGQEVSLLAEQNKEKYSKYSEQICETPIEYLRARQEGQDKISLYQITIEDGRCYLIH